MSASHPLPVRGTELDTQPALSPTRRAELTPAQAIWRGIFHCRRNEWHSGLYYFRMVECSGEVTLPGLYWSYLGHALSRAGHRHGEAIELCERAVSMEFFQPENYQNLAWVRLLSGDRRGALDALEQGRALDPSYAGWKELVRRLGARRPPVIRFLSRSHPLNRTLGRWRHALSQRRA